MNVKDKAVQEKDPVNELIQLVLANKANSEQKKELSRLLDIQAQEESKNELVQKIEKVKAVMQEQNVSLQDLIDNMKEPQNPIFVYIDKAGQSHEVFGPMRGKQPLWIAEMKKELTKEKALEMALNEAGKQWIEKIYSK